MEGDHRPAECRVCSAESAYFLSPTSSTSVVLWWHRSDFVCVTSFTSTLTHDDQATYMRAMCYAIWAIGCTKPLVQLEAITAEREFLEVLLSIDTGVHKCH